MKTRWLVKQRDKGKNVTDVVITGLELEIKIHQILEALNHAGKVAKLELTMQSDYVLLRAVNDDLLISLRAWKTEVE